jgi:hypothetical protein
MAWSVGCLIGCFITVTCHASPAIEAHPETPLQRLLDSIQVPAAIDKTVYLTETITVTDCEDYPYHDPAQASGVTGLVSDLKAGLKQGLQCLAGQGPMGPLAAYHSDQASRLIALLEGDQQKSLQCVNDELFAYAMAASPRQRLSDQALTERLHNSPGLTILLDTYRIGGLLSQKFDAGTYQTFFNLNQQQITQHLTGKPLKMQGMHRYRNLPGLLFHEMVHWLGHEHTGLYPDLTFLYETCCFDGSDFIENDAINAGFQVRACHILKDEELWSANPFQQMRLWRHKAYDQLKREMRSAYD